MLFDSMIKKDSRLKTLLIIQTIFIFHHKLCCRMDKKFRNTRYYTTFKVRKFESLFYKINTCLQKNYHLHCISGRANILKKDIIYAFFNFGRGFCDFFFMLVLKAAVSCCKKILN